MTRVVEVAGMRIQIDGELRASTDEDRAIDQVSEPLQYIDQDDYSCSNEIAAVMLTSTQARFSAEITVLDAVDPAEVPKWTVGFAQNVVTYERFAFYGSDLGGQITEDFQYYSPLRDSDIGSLPFYAFGGGATEELRLQQLLDVSCTDEPRWPIPVAVTGRGINAPLQKTVGGNTFMTWLMLARMTETDRQVVLLGKLPWQVKLEVEAGPAGIRWSVPVTTTFGAPVQLDQRYDASTIPPVGDGEDVPDLRELEAHDYVQGHLTRNIDGEHPLLVNWIYTGNECATTWERATNPAEVRNWLEGAQP